MLAVLVQLPHLLHQQTLMQQELQHILQVPVDDLQQDELLLLLQQHSVSTATVTPQLLLEAAGW